MTLDGDGLTSEAWTVESDVAPAMGDLPADVGADPQTFMLLTAAGASGNALPPDLDLSSVGTQSIRMGTGVVLDLFDLGATVTDLDGAGVPTGDAIRLQLDPDDTPAGATLTTDGIFRWTPTAAQLGRFEFVVIAVDSGTPRLADAEVFVVEVADNFAPNLAAIADEQVTQEQLFEVTITATDPDGDDLTFLLDRDDPGATLPSGAGIEQVDNNTAVIRWTPTASDGPGLFTFSVLVIDDGSPALSDREVFTVTVQGTAQGNSQPVAGDAPVAADDAYSVVAPTIPGGLPTGGLPTGGIPTGGVPTGGVPTGGLGLTVDATTGVLANDSDPDNNALTARLVNAPSNGTVVLNSDGSLVYTPAAGFQGTDSFTYVANDGSRDSNPATVTVRVVPQTHVPTAADDRYSVAVGEPLQVNKSGGVLANDQDEDGDRLVAILASAPAHGTLTLRGDGSFQYTPETGFQGTDSFTYTAKDGKEASNAATVTISVASATNAPTTADETYSVVAGQVLSVNVAGGVLANDTDEDGDTLTAVLADGPSHGTLTLNADGSFTYTPEAGFQGTDSFAYRASDGILASDAATVTINVLENHAPAAVDDEYHVIAGATLKVNAAAGTLTNDSDQDGGVLTAKLVSEPDGGSVTLKNDGSFTYTPDDGFFGTDSFTYAANDGSLDSNVATVAIHVRENHAPTAADDTFSIAEDEVLTIDVAAGVLANDADADGDALSATLVNRPAHGTLTFNSDGSFSYTPDADYFGSDTFSYKVSDGLLRSSEVTATITVSPVSDAPVAFHDAYYTDANSTHLATVTTGVLANDSDADGDTLAATVVSGPAHGVLTLNGDGSFVYTPEADFQGTDGFTYSSSDGSSEPAADATVTIHVGDGFGPVIVNEFVATGNDTLSDADGDYPDWIEIHNLSDQSVNLEGWSLTDKEGQAKWLFPAVSLDAGACLVVFASGKDRMDPAGELHTNFKLSGDGDYLALQRPDGTVTSEFDPEYPEQHYGYSYGFVAAGTAEFLSLMTPGSSNTATAVRFVDDVQVSQDAGFYEESFTVTLSVSTDGATIRYTTNGSEPTATTGVEYTGPITIDTTTVLRAAAFKDGHVTETVATRTYVFAADVIAQNNESAIAAGFPATWGSTTADYAMDQTIAAQDGTDAYEGKYAQTILADLQALPTLSLVLDVDDMFGADGIYTNPTNRGDEWERPVSVEYIDPSGQEAGFQIDAGLQIQGGKSRSSSTKQSFQLKFKSAYGASALSYPLFGKDAADEFNSLSLKSFQGDTGTAKYVRDQFAQQTQLATGDASSHGKFVQVYINGLYWGLYEVMEHIDAEWAAQYYGGEANDWDVINAGDLGNERNTATSGTVDAWNTLVAMTQELKTADDQATKSALYHKLLGENPDGTDNPDWECYLDVDNYIDYLLVEWYVQNSDWPNRNFYMFRERGADSTGFKFAVWDSEFTLDSASSMPSMWGTSLETFGTNDRLGPGQIFPGLYSCEEFRVRFSDRVQALFSEGGALYVDPDSPQYDAAHPEQNAPAARYAEVVQSVRDALVPETARWGDASGGIGGGMGGGGFGGGGFGGGGIGPGGGGDPDSELGEDPHADQAGGAATVLQIGGADATITTYIDAAGDRDAFQFTAATAGTYRVLTMAGDDQLALRVEILDAAFGLVASNETAADVRGLQVSVTEGQTYYVVVQAADAQSTGQYTLTVSESTGLPDGGGFPGGGGIVPGNGEPDSQLGDDPHAGEAGPQATLLDLAADMTSVTSFIDTAGDRDAFRFVAGATATYRIMPLPGDGQITLRVEVLDEALTVMASSDAAASVRGLQVSVTQGQTYYIVVQAADAQATGQYTLTIMEDAGFPGGGAIPGDGAIPGGGANPGGGVIPGGGGLPGGGTTNTVFTRDEVWQPAVDSLLTSYFPTRSAAFLEQVRAADLYRDAPVLAPDGGEIASGAVVSVQTSAERVYYTTDGSDPRLPDGSVSASAVVYDSSTGGGIALANSAVVKARGLSGDAWTTLVIAEFTVPVQTGPAADVRITEINYNPATPTESELAVNPALDNEDFEFIEITNVGDQAVDLTGIKFDAGITFDFTSADVKTLAPGASVLLVSNAQAFETRYGTGLNVAGQYTGQLSNGGERLRLLSAVDEVIQEFSYDDQDGWPTAADGGGYSLELVQLGSDPSDPAGWKIGALGGSPGEWAELVDGVLAGGV